jgi:hypothetical protein
MSASCAETWFEAANWTAAKATPHARVGARVSRPPVARPLLLNYALRAAPN